ncbi:MAG: zinc ABC transporter ATP-binding protein ZnuC [Rhodospirillales bacterium]|nr:zinc ABC transporter ATP-binding protein ZnuC [Rhodospirillales bacterium]MDH3917557.1 zinc ABC transporter ATP-binding protein ZnuC [Rhodospirillales bacterium]MDH3967863.1 zinc ABC transporter ATP-binding protein ZnuC [Rhodospirillales bacterium]
MPGEPPATVGGQGEPLVSVSQVEVDFDGRTVLSAVDLAVHAGEILTLIGPNGSGKTTLIRVVLGLLKPASGRVRRRAGLRIGYIPQRLHVDETLPLTVERFLRLCAPRARGRFSEVLAEVGAGHLLESALQAVSGGELKRILLAQALLRDPDLLVLDEPSAGVDVTGQAELYALIKSIRDSRRCGVLLVSHDLHLVMAATDRVICLNHHVCCTGRPEAVSRDPEYLALFGPELAERLAVYSHEHDHRHGLSGDLVAEAERAPAEDHTHG